MHRLLVLVLSVASCLAKQQAGDAGFTESGLPTNTACAAAGGECVSPTGCLAQIGDLSCGASAAICCVASGASVPTPTASLDATAEATSTPAFSGTVDAGTPGTCDQTCEAACVNDPNCIQACGC